MRLGEWLVHENLVTREGLEEALESQVVHGGRLGTNLVELGLLSERDLARALGRLHNVAFASGTMVPDPRALACIDANFADQKDVLPMRIDQTRLTVACINPHDIATMDEIAFRTGKRVVPVVIPEFRMNQLLRKHCQAFRTIRAIDMGVSRPSRAKAEREAPQTVADLMSEDEFQSLYAKILSGESATEAPPSAPALDAQEPEVLEGVIVDEPTPAPMPVAPVAPPPGPPPAVSQPAPPRAAAPPVLRVVQGGVAGAPAPAPMTPLTFAEAQQALAKSADREDVARTVLRFALGKWKRALLLNVQGPLVTGWHGGGEGVREAAVQRIGIALRGQSSFKLVCDTRSHFIGPMKRDAATAVFYRLLGGDYPTTAVMLPLLVRGRVVHILYVDNGPKQLTPPDIGELLIVGQSVARSYEELITRRKAAAAAR